MRLVLGKATAVLAVAAAMLFAPGVLAWASAADFNPAPGTYTVNTTALTLTGPGTSISGTNLNGVAVFSFGNVNIGSGVTINASGSRPFELLASGNLTLAGVINGQGVSATDFVAGPNAGGPGGGAGGTDDSQAGTGPGGGGIASNEFNGAGGGGFGGAGAAGGVDTNDGGTAGVGGSSYGNLNTTFQGGSGGGGGSTGSDSATGGGGGGGGIALVGPSVTIAATGQVRADGGDGAVGGDGASGGGSGGGILVRGNTVNVTGLLSATGGQGGAGGCCGDGGGGGGGRIAYQYSTLVASGTASVAGGTSGTKDTGACGCGSGFPSPDATGFAGVVTKVQGVVQATTGPATGVSPTGATLNGTVNPGGTATTYHFDFGTTTAYGTKIPSPDKPAGSDSANHAVAQAVTGLKPNTTYHYRIVATDSHGLVATGADVTFTTTAQPTAVTGSAMNVTKTSATVTGTVNPNGAATTFFFQYGTSIVYGSTTSTRSAGSDTSNHSESASISGLSPGKTYHFRIVAKNAAGTSYGADRTFTTPKRPLTFSVSPSRTLAGTRVCFAFKASSNGHPVAGATVRLANQAARTSHAGTATICLTLQKGTYHPSATKAGYRRAHGTITATAPPKPSFTG